MTIVYIIIGIVISILFASGKNFDGSLGASVVCLLLVILWPIILVIYGIIMFLFWSKDRMEQEVK